jgi:dolichol-phosphate mannosyltransferase
MHESDSIVIIPTYNEKENIENIIRAVFSLEKMFHILIIEDASPDGTAQIVHRLIDTEFADRLFIIERTGKQGLGTAYITGFKWALEHKYDYIFEMDADFIHTPADQPRLYAEARPWCPTWLWLALRHGVNVVQLAHRPRAEGLTSQYRALCHRFHVHVTTAGIVCYRRGCTRHRARQDTLRLRLQIRDEIYRLQDWYQDQRVSRCIHNRQEGHQQDERRIFSEALFGLMRRAWTVGSGLSPHQA